MALHPGICTAVFSAGLLSFFSPCILPLLPVYIGYFSSGEADEPSPITGRMARALAFAAGLSTVFCLMGMGAGLAGSLLQSRLFILLCGAAVVLMGLHQMGLIRIPFLERTWGLPSSIAPGRGTAGAFALGFFCSFGWTPCVGPALAMVLSVSLERGDALAGSLLLLLYAAGFAVPFVLLAAGSQVMLRRLRGLRPHLGRIRIAGGLLVAAVGVWMIAGQLPAQPSEDVPPEPVVFSSREDSPADWAGKTVYLKFWATWCPVCLSGMEEFRGLAEEYAGSGDVVICSVVAPGYNNEMDRETFSDWAAGQALSFPILLDEDGEWNRRYGIRGYPTSVFLNGDQELVEIRAGHMHNDEIREIIAKLTQKTEGSE